MQSGSSRSPISSSADWLDETTPLENGFYIGSTFSICEGLKVGAILFEAMSYY